MNEQFDAELLGRHFGFPDGGAMTRSSLVRLYTLLEGFDVTHVGLYAYLRSWRNSTDEKRLNTVWHSKAYMQAQSGLGRTSFNSKLRKLIEVGLVSELDSEVVANKKIWYVHDPLSRDQFIERYPHLVAEFFKKAEQIEQSNTEDRERRKKLAEERLAEKISELSAQNVQREG
ncbi:hypothetical protein [Pontibacillus salipaludis]|uniref:hypothetical protein n=1 Tax=Pontibacillus salipaludis TaxID=1697394 RepID=UPI0031E98BC0